MRRVKRTSRQNQFPWMTDIQWRQVPDVAQQRIRELLSQLLRKFAEQGNNERKRNDEQQ
jgi:hypothetical protein